MDSIDPACNSLKHRYDACFIKWVEGYLDPVAADAASAPSSSSPSSSTMPAAAPPAPSSQNSTADKVKARAEEYERLCGESWREYKDCVWKAVKRKDLEPLLLQAREDNPLLSPDPTLGVPSGSHK